MKIVLSDVSRKFNKQIVFRNISYTFEQGGRYAILGGNGSGKSTLLKVISSALTVSSGKAEYYQNEQILSQDAVPFNISIAAPYLELIEELTAAEFLNFHQKLKPFSKNLDVSAILKVLYLESSSNKEIRNFSSGMKQRLKLGTALLSQSSLVILDEPTSNLDPKGVEWYKGLVSDYGNGKTILVGSNFSEDEMGFCTNQLELKNYK
jgi:ABC-type multidrug transport system ATPase subunit